jgi:DNA repair exonuclease SbcCD ATPase subunit
MAEGKKKRLLVLHLAQKKEAPKVSRPRGRPPKKSTTKSKEKVEENKGKKRPGAEDQQGRASKILRTESKANIGKKVGNSGNQMLAKGAAPEIIEISDSDTGGNPQTNHPVDQDQSSSMFRLLRSWQEPWKAPEVSVPLETDEEATAWHPPLADSPVSSSDLTLGPSLTDNANMVEELHKLRRELQTERDTVHHLRQDIEKRDTNALLEKQKAGTKAKQEVANLTKELEAERQRSREQFQSYKDVLAKQTKLETDYTALEVQLEQEKSARKQEQEIHSEVLQNIIKSNTKEEHMREQVESLQSDKARLVAENEMLKAMAAAPCKIPTLSPVPSSSSSTDEEKREENVRKMYIKVKRQYDILHSVANDLATCTRSMDLSSFGEFGSYMRKLRNSLDMDGTTHTQQTTGVQKTEGDDE